MTDPLRSPKIKPWHLDRTSIVYVRQSDPQQPIKHPESTARQYALVDRAVALGWPVERIIIIDSDLGQSGASAVDREGFQKLVSEVGLGKAGIVLGLAILFIAYGFYQSWRTKQCKRRLGIPSLIVLWTSAAFVILAIFLPEILAEAAAGLLAR